MSLKAMLTAETPVPIFKTYIGNLLYSTLDFTEELVSNTSAVFGQVDIENIIYRDFADLSICKIQHHLNATDAQGAEKQSQGVRVNILSSRQKGRLGTNPSGLSVDTPAGRKVVTVAEYSKRISSDSFSAVIALADEVPLFAGYKASTKASARSLTWLKQLKATPTVDWEKVYLFGVTAAFTYDQHSTPSTLSPEIDQRIVTDAGDLLKQGCNGLVVGGAGMGETSQQLGVAIRSVKLAASETVSSSGTATAATATAATGAATAANATADIDGISAAATSDTVNGTFVISLPSTDSNNSNVLSEIGVEKRVLVMVQEMDTIKEILLAVHCGGDLIGTNLPQLLSTAGLALTWNLKVRNSSIIGASSGGSGSSGVSESISGGAGSRSGSFDKRKSSPVEGVTDCENPNKKQNISDVIIPIIHEPIPLLNVTDHQYAKAGTTTTVVTTVITAHKVSDENEEDAVVKKSHETPEEYKHALTTGGAINLWDKIHRKDLGPIFQNCSCHACTNHTRAYVHHLLHANEMLADILLYCHNQHQTVQLFNEIQMVQKEDKLVFEEWSGILNALMHEK